MKALNLDSGATAHIAAAPFEDSKALFQALMHEFRSVQIASSREMADLIKDLFAIGFSSPLVSQKIDKCLERCMYNGQRIGKDTFEAVESRGDYLIVCVEVVQENVAPFLKPLFARFKEFMAKAESFPGLK